MFRVTFETTMSSRYLLFYVRWILIGLQIICASLDIKGAVRYAEGATVTIFALLSAFAILSIVVCVVDLSIHKKGSSPPASPNFPALDYDEPATRESPGKSASIVQQTNPTAAAADNLDVLSVNEEEERVPFITPQPESTHDTSDDEKPVQTLQKPNKLVTFMDFLLALAFFALYITLLAVDNYYTNAIRVFVVLLTAITIYLHSYAFWKEAQALMKERRSKGFRKLRKGAVRI